MLRRRKRFSQGVDLGCRGNGPAWSRFSVLTEIQRAVLSWETRHESQSATKEREDKQTKYGQIYCGHSTMNHIQPFMLVIIIYFHRRSHKKNLLIKNNINGLKESNIYLESRWQYMKTNRLGIPIVKFKVQATGLTLIMNEKSPFGLVNSSFVFKKNKQKTNK